MKLDIKNKTLKQVVNEMAMLNEVDKNQFHFKGRGNGEVEVVNDRQN